MKISLCFRLDDPHACGDRSLESRIFDLFAHYQVPLLVAVLPFYRVPGSRKLVGASRDHMPHVDQGLRFKRIELAQHGYSHLCRTGALGRDPSEFAGVDEPTQARLIMDGRRQLEEGFATTVTGFVPPWNSYDRTTARVLASAGFRFISAGTAAPAYPRNVAPARDFPAIPRTCTLKSLEPAIEQALRFRRARPAVVCVFHPDDFVEFSHPPDPGEPPPSLDLRDLEQKLSWCSSIPEIAMCSVSQLAKEARQTGKLTHIGNTWWYHGVPHRYRHRLPQSILVRGGIGSMLPAIVGV